MTGVTADLTTFAARIIQITKNFQQKKKQIFITNLSQKSISSLTQKI